MSAENRKLDDLRQYVSSIYRIMQSQIETKLDAEGNPLPDNVNDTLQEINTKLALHNSFQQENIFETFVEVKDLLLSIKNQLNELSENPEEQLETTVELNTWRILKLNGSITLSAHERSFGDIIAFVLRENKQTITMKTPYAVTVIRGPNFIKRSFSPYYVMAEEDTEIEIQKSKILSSHEVSKRMWSIFSAFREHHDVNSKYELTQRVFT